MEIDGVPAVPTTEVLLRLSEDYPGVSLMRIRAVLVAEWAASTGGVPLVIPPDIEPAAREALARLSSCAASSVEQM